MCTWDLDCSDHRERILVDLVVGRLYYSSILGFPGGLVCCYAGLPSVDLLGVNAVFQFLTSVVRPCLYSGVGNDTGTGLHRVVSRLLLPVAVSTPSIELVRACLMFCADYRGRLCGESLEAVWGKFVFLATMGGDGVLGLFSANVVTDCCGVVFPRLWGFERTSSDWSSGTWFGCCTCGAESRLSLSVPPLCLLVRASGGGVTALATLDLTDRAMSGVTVPLVYDLLATCVRAPSGRYVCYSRRPRHVSLGWAWWRFDDEVVEVSNLDDVCSVPGVVFLVYSLSQPLHADVVRSESMGLVDVHWKPSL